MISVIIPIYNVEPYLEKCIDSIIGQTYKDLEVILIDDGSPDRCGEICDEYARHDCRISVYHNDNQGLSAARNFGIKKAKGDFISFVDSDDWLEPDMYEVLIKKMKATGADIGVCGIWHEYGGFSKTSHFSDTVYLEDTILEALIDDRINTGVWNKLYLKQLFDSILFPVGVLFEDTAIMHLVFAKSKSVVVLSTPKYHYRQRVESLSKNHTAKNLMDCANVCINRYYYYANEKPDIFLNKRDVILRYTTLGIDRLWRWWYGCSRDEKREYKHYVIELKEFSIENIPFFGFPSWPLTLRLSSIFLHSDSNISFFIIYYLNQIYRKMSRTFWMD